MLDPLTKREGLDVQLKFENQVLRLKVTEVGQMLLDLLGHSHYFRLPRVGCFGVSCDDYQCS
jgi:hypothetical protein